MSALPAPHASLADQLMSLARLVEGEGEGEIAARPGQLDRLDAIANRLRALSGLKYERRAGAVDWPARFRAAAEVADEARYVGTQSDLRRLAGQLASLAICDPQVVEAIGRALLGEES